MNNTKLTESLDISVLTNLQHEFALLTGLMMRAITPDKKELAPLMGDNAGTEKALELSSTGKMNDLIDRIKEDALEDQADDYFEDNTIHAAVLAVRFEKQDVFFWEIFDFNNKDRKDFELSIDFIRDCSLALVTSKLTKALSLGTDIHTEPVNTTSPETGIKLLKHSERLLQKFFDNTFCGIYIRLKEDHETLFANSILKNWFMPEFKKGTFDAFLDRCTFSADKTCEYYDNDKAIWLEIHRASVSLDDSTVADYFTFFDITPRKMYISQLERQPYTDFLTGLPNRMKCENDLAVCLDDIENSHDTSQKGAILYLDMDDFKHINDGLGHHYGDILLKEIAKKLLSIEGVEDMVYRVGGDEFIIIITPPNYPALPTIISEIKALFQKTWLIKDKAYYCTASLGYVLFPHKDASVNELINMADQALFEAKRRGKSLILKYTKDIDSASYKRLELEKNMRNAIECQCREFAVYYQPIMDISGETPVCCGAEALVRWDSPAFGFISPSDFISFAEYLGLINPIGNHVLKNACIMCSHWNNSGFPFYHVNVNLSVVQLLQANILDLIKTAIDESGINPSKLTLEVTESLAINDLDHMKEILSSLRKLGIKIALDDFGTGYSSLNHIKALPFDIIKIDQTFVKDLTTDPYQKAFIKMVAELAHSLGAEVCVEGVETKEQFEIIKDMTNVKYIQGFYFDVPLSSEDYESKYITPDN